MSISASGCGCAGTGVSTCPTQIVRHVSSALSGYRSDFAVYHGERNAVWTFVKNMPGPLFWLYLPQHLALNMAALLFYPWRGQGRVAWRAKRDALLGLPDRAPPAPRRAAAAARRLASAAARDGARPRPRRTSAAMVFAAC